MRNKENAKNVDVQLYLEDFEKLQFKLEYLDAKTLESANVKHNGENLAKCEDFTGDLNSLNALKQWGAIFV